jgi:hypothetical protein
MPGDPKECRRHAITCVRLEPARLRATNYAIHPSSRARRQGIHCSLPGAMIVLLQPIRSRLRSAWRISSTSSLRKSRYSVAPSRGPAANWPECRDMIA